MAKSADYAYEQEEKRKIKFFTEAEKKVCSECYQRIFTQRSRQTGKCFRCRANSIVLTQPWSNGDQELNPLE